MCHTTGVAAQNEQIDKFVENGMPVKLVKKVNSLINRKRRLENRKNRSVENPNNEPIQENPQKSNEESKIILPQNLKENVYSPKTQNDDHSHTATSTTTTTSTNSNSVSTSITTKPLTPGSIVLPVPSPLTSMPTEPVRKVLTCPFTSNKRIITVTPATLEQDKQKKIANIASFHFKERQNSLSQGHAEQPDLDLLGSMTQYSKHFFFYVNHLFGKMQSSRCYTFVTQKPQPFTVFGVLIMSYIILALGPDLRGDVDQDSPVDDYHVRPSSSEPKNSQSLSQALGTIMYLGLFATHFGSQIWMTFVSGLSLYFNLPRHVFGQCQQILFPRYFLFNGILSSFMLILYLKFFINSWSVVAAIQVATLALTALIEFIVRLYLAPPMLVLMHEKYKIEETVGSGTEVGMIVQGDLAQCPHYQRIHKAFRRSHMLIAICNMTILGFTLVNLFSLAFKIQIS